MDVLPSGEEAVTKSHRFLKGYSEPVRMLKNTSVCVAVSLTTTPNSGLSISLHVASGIVTVSVKMIFVFREQLKTRNAITNIRIILFIVFPVIESSVLSSAGLPVILLF
jgi:hypothetical protein